MKLKLFCCLAFMFITFSVFTSVAATNNKTGCDVFGTLSGTITDKADGKPVIGATVSVPDLRIGSITDANGKYTINHLPKGIYLVQVSYIGYATFNQRVDFSKVSTLDVKLQL